MLEKKQTKSGNQCHDLRFIKHDDAEMFHDSDEETDDDPTPPPTLPDFATSAEWHRSRVWDSVLNVTNIYLPTRNTNAPWHEL